jgi:hypothetical protein
MRMSIRPRTLLALTAVLGMASPVLAIDLVGRTPEGYECQSKAAAIVAKLAGKVAKCRERGLGSGCINEATDDFQERLANTFDKFFEKVNPTRCVTGVCGREDSGAECASSMLEGPGHPEDGNGELGFKCLEKTSKQLVKFSRATSKCRKDDAKAVASGHPSTLDSCITVSALENIGGLVSVLDKLRQKGGSPETCGLRGECTENDDSFRCADAIMAIAVEEAKLGAVADGSDVQGRTDACRASANDILIDVAKGAADCREEEAKAVSRGGTFDVVTCLNNVIDRWAEKVAALLAKNSEKGVAPDRCLPNNCAPGDSAGDCALKALEDIAGL